MLAVIDGWRRDGCRRVWVVHGFAPDQPLVMPLLQALQSRYPVVVGMNVPGLFYGRIDALAL